MDYRRIGKSGLKVSAVGLGTNAFGSRADEQTSIRIVEHALEGSTLSTQQSRIRRGGPRRSSGKP